MEENLEKLKEGTFYYSVLGMHFSSEIIGVKAWESDSKTIEIKFQGGELYSDCFESVNRPADFIADFEWCYKLKNEYGDFIGYIGKESAINK